MNKTQQAIRNLRLKATRLYGECKFEEFKKLSRIANKMEHDYKMATQPRVGA